MLETSDESINDWRKASVQNTHQKNISDDPWEEERSARQGESNEKKTKSHSLGRRDVQRITEKTNASWTRDTAKEGEREERR